MHSSKCNSFMFNLKLLEINYLSITIKTKTKSIWNVYDARFDFINVFFYVRSLNFFFLCSFFNSKNANENPKNPNKSDKNMWIDDCMPSMSTSIANAAVAPHFINTADFSTTFHLSKIKTFTVINSANSP